MTDSTGDEIAALGFKRALLVFGQGSVIRTGTLDRVKASLEPPASPTPSSAG